MLDLCWPRTTATWIESTVSPLLRLELFRFAPPRVSFPFNFSAALSFLAALDLPVFVFDPVSSSVIVGSLPDSSGCTGISSEWKKSHKSKPESFSNSNKQLSVKIDRYSCQLVQYQNVWIEMVLYIYLPYLTQTKEHHLNNLLSFYHTLRTARCNYFPCCIWFHLKVYQCGL